MASTKAAAQDKRPSMADLKSENNRMIAVSTASDTVSIAKRNEIYSDACFSRVVLVVSYISPYGSWVSPTVSYHSPNYPPRYIYNTLFQAELDKES